MTYYYLTSTLRYPEIPLIDVRNFSLYSGNILNRGIPIL